MCDESMMREILFGAAGWYIVFLGKPIIYEGVFSTEEEAQEFIKNEGGSAYRLVYVGKINTPIFGEDE